MMAFVNAMRTRELQMMTPDNQDYCLMLWKKSKMTAKTQKLLAERPREEVGGMLPFSSPIYASLAQKDDQLPACTYLLPESRNRRAYADLIFKSFRRTSYSRYGLPASVAVRVEECFRSCRAPCSWITHHKLVDPFAQLENHHFRHHFRLLEAKLQRWHWLSSSYAVQA